MDGGAALDVLPTGVGERLLYRSQFVLGPRFVDTLPTWRRVELTRGLRLSAHPDLSVARAAVGGCSVTLLGFALDPFHAAATNADIAHGLAEDLAAGIDVFQRPATLGGRWVMIADDGRTARLFHDPIGLRQVYYTDVGRTGALWCASQPAIVAATLGLPANEDALALFTRYPRPDQEHRLPVQLSSHAGIKRLLPNHYLDLSSGRIERYWPVRPFEPIELADCLEKSAVILDGLMDSAARRFPLAISMTAGRDSRLVLASARRVAAQASYITVAKPSQPAADREAPARLLGRLGLRHEIIPWPAQVDEEFAKTFRQNVTTPHEVYVPEAFAVFRYNQLTKVGVTGSAVELARPRWRDSRLGRDKSPTAERLTENAKFGDSGLVIEAYRGWLERVPTFKDPDVMQLSRWETGSWLATAQQEFDVAWQDILAPFNNRLLITTMLSLDRRLRWGPRYLFFEELMRTLWPEVLTEPFPKMRRPFFLSPPRVRHIVRQLRQRLPGRPRS